MIVFDRQDVVASSFEDLGTNIAMREHRIARNDLALDRQHSQQFQRRLVFIRLGVDPELSHGGVDVGGIGGHQVGCGRILIPTSPGGLTIDGKMKSRTGREASLDPLADARLKVGDVDPSKNPRVGGLAEAATPGEPKEIEEFPASLLAVLSDRLV